YAISVFREGRSALAEVLDACRELTLPALFHLEGGGSARDFLCPEPTVAPPGSDGIAGEWLGAYWKQLDQTLGRLRKLHFKNLGALLRLQEGLDPSLFGAGERAPESGRAQPIDGA